MSDNKMQWKKGKTSIIIKIYRAERWCWTHHMRILAKIIWRLMQIMFACYIPPSAVLGDGVKIGHGLGIVIHHNAEIGDGTVIYQNVTIGVKGPKIGKNCILGTGCVILGDIRIGDNVKIGANAVVLEDIPDNCTVVGVPGRIIKKDGVRVDSAHKD